VRRPGVDVTKWSDAINLLEVVDYAKAKKVRLWLWTHWQALDEQMEDALALYEKLGVAGIKVDFMDRDDQWMVNWYTRLLGAAARHHLMVDLHGAYPPRGTTRTWPNFMTQEGVLAPSTTNGAAGPPRGTTSCWPTPVGCSARWTIRPAAFTM
jgi:alpha-glucosidase